MQVLESEPLASSAQPSEKEQIIQDTSDLFMSYIKGL